MIPSLWSLSLSCIMLVSSSRSFTRPNAPLSLVFLTLGPLTPPSCVQDSPHCLSFDLFNLPFVPERNGLTPFEGGLVTNDAAHVLGLLALNGVPVQRPKVFSRLLRITDEKRNQWIKIQAEMTESRKERAEKRAKMKAHNRARRQKRRLEKKSGKGSSTKGCA